MRAHTDLPHAPLTMHRQVLERPNRRLLRLRAYTRLLRRRMSLA